MTGEEAITPEWLNKATKKIEDDVRAADDGLLEAANLLVKIKAYTDDGVFGELTWRDWSTQTLSIGPRRIRELLRIGKAANPLAELAEQRAANGARQQRHRAARTERTRSAPRLQSAAPVDALEVQSVNEAAVSAEAMQLIKWAHTARGDQIKRVLAFIAEL